MLSHVDRENRPAMVNVGAKPVTRRTARARAVVDLLPQAAVLFDGRDLQTAKGPVFHSAILAGVMAAKRTHELIPLCHPLPLDDCAVRIHLEVGGSAVIEATATAEARTGVEMEALTAVTIAALTLYDMVKALGHGTIIREIALVEKTGGKSDYRAGRLAKAPAAASGRGRRKRASR